MSFEFDKGVLSKMRKGNASDPFISIEESQQVVNSKVVLSEIPDRFVRVQVSGEGSSWYEIERGLPSENQYLVSYIDGVIHFHPSRNGSVLQFNYKGRGIQYISSKRVYTQSENNEVIKTLDDSLNDATNAITNVKINAEQSINQTRMQALSDIQDKANEVSDQSSQALQDAQQALADANQTKALAADILNDSANILSNANEAVQASGQVVENAKLRYLPYVETYDDIATTYPSPENGDRVQTAEDGVVYRFQNGKWEAIERSVVVEGGNIVSDIIPPNDKNNFWVDLSN